MSFIKTLRSRWQSANSLLCVGLDPDPTRMPGYEGDDPVERILRFNTAIIKATADLVCAFKPQIAGYSACAAEEALRQTIALIHRKHPDIPVILDAKRGDVGHTANHYVHEAFARFGADAVTLNPYLGGDSLEPFLQDPQRGAFLLCRTSNPGSGELQGLELADGRRLFEAVADLAAGSWNSQGNVGLVVGATYPRELRAVRQRVGDMPLLVPGVGAQGGDLNAVLRNGLDDSGTGLLINASRSIIYAGQGEGYAEAARWAARELRDAINRARSELGYGN